MHSYGIGKSIITVFKVCAQLYNQGVWLNLNSHARLWDGKIIEIEWSKIFLSSYGVI